MLKRTITLFLLMVLVVGWLPMSTAQSQTPEQPSIVLVDASDPSAVEEVQSSGGVLLTEYEAASLWRVPGAVEENSSRPAITQVDNAILLRGITIQPGQEEPAVPNMLQQSAPAGDGLWIVQFAGPVQPEWLDGLLAAGLEIVAYLPNNAYIVWGEHPSARLQSLSAENPLISWQGAFHPYYRLAPQLRPNQERAPLAEMVDVAVQLYQTETTADTLARLEARAETVLRGADPVGNLINIRVRIPSADLVEIASWPEVLNIESYVTPQLNDEVQGQIMAGNVSSTSGEMLLPSGPGYLKWLMAKGFPVDSNQYPIVDVTDDGLDTGDYYGIAHPDFYFLGKKSGYHRIAYINNCTSDPLGNAVGGHGNLNAGIVGGYNETSGAPYKDARGYSYGLGISPYGKLAASKIFSNDGIFELDRCGNSVAQLVQNAYSAGARITSNSWGAPVYGEYTIDAQEYDYLTRDASFLNSGNQEMFHIFSAGNDGPISKSIGSPGTAKNVLTVGATENVRDQGIIDGCGEMNGNNAADMATFSSRGPAVDGRSKPDLVAPGTHIIGPASQDASFTGTGVCGMPSSSYYPNTQNLYTWSTGTSHSTPAVAGAAQLSYNYFSRVLMPGAVPSPAMQKALLINTPRYLQGYAANDTLPSSAQGWGMADLGAITDGTPRIFKDQDAARVFTSSGQSPYEITGVIADPSKPFKVSLVWTDAPGNPNSAVASVNNLNLEVVADGKIYKGNVFNKNFSAPGGSFDSLNNVENIYLPAGVSGTFRIRVYPQSIAGNAIPGNSFNVDQDFAMVVYNGTEATSDVPVLTLDTFSAAEALGNGNGAYDPGETINVQIGLGNLGTASADSISAWITTTDPLVTVTNTAIVPTILPGETQIFSPNFLVNISVVHQCAGSIPLYLNLEHGPYRYTMRLPDLAIGATNNRTQAFTASGLPAAVPVGTEHKVLPLTIPSGVIFHDVNVQISITHNYVGDLKLVLVNPSGYASVLSDENGFTGKNYTNTVFDDEAAQFIFNGIPPYTGSYRPETPLSIFDSVPSEGTWKLEVHDAYPSVDGGIVTDFTLLFQNNSPVCTIAGTKETLFLPLMQH